MSTSSKGGVGRRLRRPACIPPIHAHTRPYARTHTYSPHNEIGCPVSRSVHFRAEIGSVARGPSLDRLICWLKLRFSVLAGGDPACEAVHVIRKVVHMTDDPRISTKTPDSAVPTVWPIVPDLQRHHEAPVRRPIPGAGQARAYWVDETTLAWPADLLPKGVTPAMCVGPHHGRPRSAPPVSFGLVSSPWSARSAPRSWPLIHS